MNIKELAKKYEQYTIDMRREFHMNPELSMQEVKTANRIKEELTKIGVAYESIGDSGVVATIKGKNPGKTIALRADIDALEVNEVRDVPYKSKNEGVMHACGHDAHGAMLLGAAHVLNELKDELKGTVKLMFQPAEEVAQGAKALIAGGVLDGVDEVFGMHVMGNFPTGKIAVGAGPRMASADMFKITVKGVGGHGSMPNLGVDALVAASAIVMNLQTLVSREVSPMESVVVSVGKLISGTRFNVIADEAIMEGTTRCFSYEVREQLPSAMERIIKSTAASYRAEAELEYNFLTAPTINNEESTERAKKSIEKIMSKDAVVEMPKMAGSEDFSEYLAIVPGTFAIVGTANKEKDTCYANHHPMFDIDEDMLVNGVALHAQYAFDYLMNE
ncbi:MAG: amidohydrolase [Tissierellia bacterium]|nr:amidohydrolase [Tissierellia bacterium]HKM00497.1 M20 family metallopeptidase [Sedimentibacter sp.]